METKKFQKRIEDFICERCGTKTKGKGYTNHCSECLWSKHLDVNPGDRSAQCRGMMEPVGVEKKKDEYTILYRCRTCGMERKNKAAPEDNFDVLISLASDPFKKIKK